MEPISVSVSIDEMRQLQEAMGRLTDALEACQCRMDFRVTAVEPGPTCPMEYNAQDNS